MLSNRLLYREWFFIFVFCSFLMAVIFIGEMKARTLEGKCRKMALEKPLAQEKTKIEPLKKRRKSIKKRKDFSFFHDFSCRKI